MAGRSFVGLMMNNIGHVQYIQNKSLGSKPASELLEKLKPPYWFSAHLHCKFAALLQHDDDPVTKLLALDKCISGWMQLFGRIEAIRRICSKLATLDKQYIKRM